MREPKTERREPLEDLIRDPDSYQTWSDNEEEREKELIKCMITSQIWGEE
jgi:hypothetical protein